MDSPFQTDPLRLAGPFPADLLAAVNARLARWSGSDRPGWFRYSALPAPASGGPASAELHVVVLVQGVLLDVRAATDGFSSSLIPLRAIDRVRLIRKPDRTQIEIRHGDCITWLERKEDDAAGLALDVILEALEGALAR
jgi:hypothetical protein